jgi:hypothetical protein
MEKVRAGGDKIVSGRQRLSQAHLSAANYHELAALHHENVANSIRRTGGPGRPLPRADEYGNYDHADASEETAKKFSGYANRKTESLKKYD